MSRRQTGGGREAGNLLQNENEAEVKHLQRLMKHPPAWAGKEVKVVTWGGGWLCICGRICWPKQHCKACGETSPCRGWCFEAGCDRADCRYTHPTFYLPKDTPPVGRDGRRLDGREDLLKLPPPNALPAVVLAQRRAAVEQAAAARQLQPQQQGQKQQQQQQKWEQQHQQVLLPTAANQQHQTWAPQQRVPAVDAAYNAAAESGGGASGGMWAELAAQAQASMASATSGTAGTAGGGTAGTAGTAGGGTAGTAGTAGASSHVLGAPPLAAEAAPAALQRVPAVGAPPSQKHLPAWDACHAEPQQPPGVVAVPAAEAEEDELEAYLTMLGIGNDHPALTALV